MHRVHPSQIAIAAALMLGASPASFAQSAAEAELAHRVDRLAAELADVKAQLAQMKQKAGEQAGGALGNGAINNSATTAAAVGNTVSPGQNEAGGRYALIRPQEPATVFTSYGELNYNRPVHDSRNARADLRRFVLGFQHRFDDRTRVVTELEVEHAVSSADDVGETEIEQAYVERQLNARWAARGGLFLMPAGLLNENHEPTAYYGVERNFVETAIIPSTWREGGLQMIGRFDNGLTFQGGISTGFDLNKWDAASPEGAESPLGSIHQELSMARARNLAVFGALNWRGIPGLLVGGSLFSGKADQGQDIANSRITLWDLHARWTPDRWDLSALYARGSISNTAALNTPLVGNPTLIPKSFDGAYVQAAYRLWSHDDYVLSPFVRLERFNTAKSFASLGAGLTPSGAPNERVITIGANFQVTPGVVLKADYQRFRENRDFDRIDLGLGWSF